MRCLLIALLLLSSFSFAWLPGWSYRLPVNITSAVSLTDYQVQVNPNIYNNTGLVGSWHFSEGSGTRAADSSGFGNDGTLTNGPAWVSGKFGSGLQFDGIDDYSVTPSSQSLNPAAISISMWVKAAYPDTGDGSYHIVLIDPNAKYQIYIYPNGDLDFGNYVDTNLAVDVGAWGATWHHIAVTQEEGTNNTRIYFDSVLKKTGTVSRAGSTAGALYFGRREISSQFFNGTIDEVRIFNRSLSAQEISELYNAQKARLDYADLRFTQLYTIYETPISISGTGSNLTEYQVMLNITNSTILSHMRSDGADLRFFSSQTSTPYSSSGLSYWIESINSTKANVWVKANVSSGGSTIYMYYGNASASAQSNGSATFAFFDHFEGSALDGKWTCGAISTQYGAGSCVVSNSVLTLTGGTNTWWGAFAGNAPKSSLPFVIDYYAKISAAGQFGASDVASANPAPNDVMVVGFDGYTTMNNAVGAAVGPIPDLSSWTRVRMAVYSGAVDFYLNGSLAYHATANIPDAPMAARTGAAQPSGIVFVDYVFIHKYSSTEPSASVGSETAISSEVSLPYWLESDRSAWVKVSYIPIGASTLYLYSSNPNVTSAGNGTSTFVLFDDFEDGDYSNGPVWTKYGSASWSASSRYMSGSGGGTYYAGTPFSQQYNLSWNVKARHTGAAADYLWRFLHNGADVTGNGVAGQANGGIYFYCGGTTFSGSLAFDTKWHSYSITRGADGWKSYVDSTLMGSSADTGGCTATYFVMQDNSNAYDFDDVFVRRYLSPEPVVAYAAAEQQDIVPPSVSVSSPANSIYFSSSIPLNFTATDASGISECKYELNGLNTTLAGCQNLTMNASSGPNSLTVWAFDGANWGSASVSFNVSLDTTPPGISISSPANVSYSSASVPVAFIASDASGVSSCVVRLNGSINSSSCSNYSLLLGNGAYTLNVSTNDTFGNSNSSAVSFTVSLTVSVSNSTTTNSNGIGNVSLSGIPPAASSIVYSIGSSSFSRSFAVSSGVSSVRISARTTLQGTPMPGKQMAFSVS